MKLEGLTRADLQFCPNASTIRSQTSDFPEDEPPATPMMKGKQGADLCDSFLMDAADGSRPEAADVPCELAAILVTISKFEQLKSNQSDSLPPL